MSSIVWSPTLLRPQLRPQSDPSPTPVRPHSDPTPTRSGASILCVCRCTTFVAKTAIRSLRRSCARATCRNARHATDWIWNGCCRPSQSILPNDDRRLPKIRADGRSRADAMQSLPKRNTVRNTTRSESTSVPASGPRDPNVPWLDQIGPCLVVRRSSFPLRTPPDRSRSRSRHPARTDAAVRTSPDRAPQRDRR